MAYENLDLGFLDEAWQSPGERAYVEEAGDFDWTVNNSGLFDYSRGAYFPEFSGRGGLRTIIEDSIGFDPQFVALDIAGGTNGIALRELLDMGAIGKGLVTNYMDLRDKETRNCAELSHVSGDLLDPVTWKKILAWSQDEAPEGLDLVLHRPRGGLQNLSPETYEGGLHAVLNLMRPGGIFFCQIPWSLLEWSETKYSADLQRICKGIENSGLVDKIFHSDTDKGDAFAVLQRAA